MTEQKTPLPRIALLAVLLTVAFGSWIYAAPEASDPDGNFHLTSIWCGGGFRQGVCEQALTNQGKPVIGVVRVPEAVAKAKNGLNELSSQEFVFSTYHNLNSTYGDYPKGFFWVQSKFLQTSITQTVLILRWINVLLFVLFFVLANRLLSENLRISLNLAQLVLLMPLGIFVIASNNPSSWAVTGVSTYWAFLFGFLTSKSKRNTFLLGLLSFLSATTASFARGDAAMFVVAISVLVVLVVYARKLVELRKLFSRCKLLIFVLFSTLVSVFSSGHSQTISEGFTDPKGYLGRNPSTFFDLDINRVLYNFVKMPEVLMGAFGLDGTSGELGWGDVPIPEMVFLGMFSLLNYLILNCFGKRSKLELLSLSSLLLGLCFVALKILHESGKVLPQFIQTRYFIPLLVALFGLYLSGSTLSLRIAESKTLRRFIATALITSFALSLHSTMSHYIHQTTIFDWNLNDNRVWWWDGEIQPMTIWSIGSMAFAKLVSMLFLETEIKNSKSMMRRIRVLRPNQMSHYLDKPKLNQLPHETAE
jgi:hypothetical protein